MEGKKEIELWGSGNASREFLYVEDAADGIIKATEFYNKPEPINLGSGKETKIKYLAYEIKEIIGFQGEILWNNKITDGQPRRVLDVTKARKEFGFSAKTNLEEGLKKTIDWYMKNNK